MPARLPLLAQCCPRFGGWSPFHHTHHTPTCECRPCDDRSDNQLSLAISHQARACRGSWARGRRRGRRRAALCALLERGAAHTAETESARPRRDEQNARQAAAVEALPASRRCCQPHMFGAAAVQRTEPAVCECVVPPGARRCGSDRALLACCIHAKARSISRSLGCCENVDRCESDREGGWASEPPAGTRSSRIPGLLAAQGSTKLERLFSRVPPPPKSSLPVPSGCPPALCERSQRCVLNPRNNNSQPLRSTAAFLSGQDRLKVLLLLRPTAALPCAPP